MRDMTKYLNSHVFISGNFMVPILRWADLGAQINEKHPRFERGVTADNQVSHCAVIALNLIKIIMI